jgi:hypothetical protein
VPEEDHGLLIIRAWTQVGSAEPLRITIRTAGDVSTGIEATATFTQPDAAGAFVTSWLQEFSDAAE